MHTFLPKLFLFVLISRLFASNIPLIPIQGHRFRMDSQFLLVKTRLVQIIRRLSWTSKRDTGEKIIHNSKNQSHHEQSRYKWCISRNPGSRHRARIYWDGRNVTESWIGIQSTLKFVPDLSQDSGVVCTWTLWVTVYSVHIFSFLAPIPLPSCLDNLGRRWVLGLCK